MYNQELSVQELRCRMSFLRQLKLLKVRHYICCSLVIILIVFFPLHYVGRLMKLADMKAAVDVSDAQKQAMSETADAFRGVHLDPNAHHWDEVSTIHYVLSCSFILIGY